MTDKEMLHLLVDNMPEEQVEIVIDFVTELANQSGESCESCKIGGYENGNAET